ncbi:MAG: hypothetical protein ACHQ4J_11185 [Candidatus Binatia bacterium]
MSQDALSPPSELGAGGNMARFNRSSLAQGGGAAADDDDLDLFLVHPVTGGEPRTGQLTGTKALMLAVLEDGIRSYLGGSKIIANEADFWIHSHRRQSPFSFVVVCEMLGLDPGAVRKTLARMKSQNMPSRKVFPRARHNVRIPGRVHARRVG